MNETERDVPIAVWVGSRVRQRRVAEKLSLEAVARALGKSPNDLQLAEAGQMELSASDIVHLCGILRVLPSWFFDDLL